MLRPDWVCEIGTDGTARRRDGVKKRRIYADHSVPWYWLLDVEHGQLTVLKLVSSGYSEVLEVGRGVLFRAEPFEGIELSVEVLLGEE
jgi:Uma2 family endonuclease